MRKMNKRNVLWNEQWSNDAAEEIFANLEKYLLRRQETNVWGPSIRFLNRENSHDSVQTGQNDMHKKMFKSENVSSYTEISEGDEKELCCAKGNPLNNGDVRRPPKSLSVNEDKNLRSVKSKIDQTDENYGNMTKKTVTREIQNHDSKDFCVESSHIANNEFSDWCKKRQEEYTLASKPKAYSNTPTKKRNRPKSKSPTPEIRKTRSYVAPRHIKFFSKSMTQLDIPRDETKTQVCIKIADERNDRRKEFTVDMSDLSRIKRTFPKLKEVLPEVDAGKKTALFSMETVNSILRYVFLRHHNKDAMPSATIGVEILAAIKAWEINKFQNIFLTDFRQKILSSSNANLVFSLASHYDLKDICNFCKEIAEDGIYPTSYQKKQKMCFITISTYVEPIEFSIPFQSIKENFELSFEKPIRNTLRFQAVSGSFTIIGIHIQLNDSLEKCCNSNMLGIEYTTKNLSEDRKIETGQCEKPLRPINVIYFNKPVVVKPKQTVEIMVETDAKPFLCSAFPKDKELKKLGKGREFCLTIDSDVKLSKSGENVCIVGKLLYNV